MSELRDITTRELLERLNYLMRNNHKSYKNGMNCFLKKFNSLYKKEQKRSTKELNGLKEVIKDLTEKVSVLDETFLLLYSNIKRNQFLYAHFPEEWNETFLQFKERLKQENEEFKKSA